MFDELYDKIKQIMASRLIPITIILFVLFGILVNRLFEIQIIRGEENTDVASLQETRTIETDPARGLIRASNGEIIADNEPVYTVELYDVLSSNTEKNEMLAYLIETLKEYSNEINLSIPISYNNGVFEFTESGSSLRTFKTNAFAEGKLTEEREEATAEEVFEYMRDKRFHIDEEYSIEEALEIITLRYAMYVVWPPQNPVVICSNVDEETVVAIKERAPQLQGVTIGKETKRFYIENNEPFAHILGYTGLINEGELASLENQGIDIYNSTDNIGKAGIEKSFESVLFGEKGITTLEVDGLGKAKDVLSSEDPVAGSDIYLTIDPDLQRAIYQIVEQNLSGILLSKINNSKDAGTKGESSSNIRVPIYDVYFAMINNEIIDIDHLKENDASDIEKQVYDKFLNKLEEVFRNMRIVLAPDSSRTSSDLSEEMNEYMSHIYKLLDSDDIIDNDKLDKQDGTYKEFKNDNISLSQYLQYAISNNWINLDELEIDNEYYATEELYTKLLAYIKDFLIKDEEFHKMIYYYLIDSYKLSGTEICLLLIDQGVLEYNEEEVNQLKNGTTSSYTFITDKIRNLELTPAQVGLEPFSASVIVTDVASGKVLSMVSYPSYDSNNYADYFSNNLTSPLYPRAVNEALAPGSTYKMVTSIAGLEKGVITPHEKIKDEYYFTKVQKNIKDAPSCHFNNHGLVNVVEAIEVSCNYYFYELGYRLATTPFGYNQEQGLDTLGYYANLLGLGQGGNTNLEKELSTKAYTSVSKNDVIRSSIGQGDNIYTPAELATYITTIANRGKRFDLTLIDKIYDGEKYVNNEANYTQLDEIQDSTWDYVQEGMYLVCNGGKGSTSELFSDLADAGISVAGKTGTSQLTRYNANHALFTSYGPFENPEISVTVVIPNGYSSGNAAELAKDIYSYYFNVKDEEELLSGQAEQPEADTPAFSD